MMSGRGDEKPMNHVDIMSDIQYDYIEELIGKKNIKTIIDNRGNTYEIDDKHFEAALGEGLIEKTDQGYVFIGKRKELEKFTNK